MPGFLVRSVVDPNVYWVFDDKLGDLEEFIVRTADAHFLATRVKNELSVIKGAPCWEYDGWEFVGEGIPVEHATITFRVYVNPGKLTPKVVVAGPPVEGVESWLK